MSEVSILNLLDATACGRVNILFGEHGLNYGFTIHPPIHPIEPQVNAPAWLAAAMLWLGFADTASARLTAGQHGTLFGPCRWLRAALGCLRTLRCERTQRSTCWNAVEPCATSRIQ